MQAGIKSLILVVVLAALMGCAPASGPAQATEKNAMTAETDRLVIRGEVLHLSIEGGFWGIVGDDGRRYDPGEFPREFQQPGLKVRVEAKAAIGRISFRQWGTPIEIIQIEKLATP